MSIRSAFVIGLTAHGLIHVMSFAKAFGLVELPQLTQPISRPLGIAWLAAGLLVLLTAALFLMVPRLWWAIALGAVLVSQAVIVSSWSDAKVGTVVNVLVLIGAVYGFASEGQWSFHAEYRRQVVERLTQSISPRVITEADLAHLPDLVQRYVRLSGAVGQPRVHHVKASWNGRIRATPSDPWMVFAAEQHNFIDEPARFFRMDATRSGLPVDVLHTFRGQSATMRVRLLSLVPLVDATGPEMNRAETVTLFNDLCVLAPAALIDPSIHWEPVDTRSVRGHYTVGANTVSAVLLFNDAGGLVDFVSDDRLVASPDGKTFTRQRWSTPITDYRTFGPWRVATRGEGRWHLPESAFAYIELDLLDLEVNGGH